MHNRLDIRIDRDGLRPQDLNAEELGSFITHFAALVRKGAEEPEEAVSSLTGIESNCIRLQFAMTRPALMAYAGFIAYETGRMFERHPPKFDCNRDIEEINRFCERNSVHVNFPVNGRKGEVLKVSGEQKLKSVEQRQVSMSTTIYGTVENVGGVKPNVHIRYHGKSLVCNVNRDLAQELGKRLYETVGLTGNAQVVNGEVVAFRVTDIAPYTPSTDPLDGLRKLEAKYGHFDHVNADQYVAEQRE